MAEPLPGQTPTPAAPANPFGDGATGNIDRQKALLNDIIAMGGTPAAQLYGEQDVRTQEMLRQRMQAAPSTVAQQGIYEAFRRDAEEARRQHAETQQRQMQLGNLFMDQAKGAVPIHAKNVDAMTEALRMQFEARARADAEAAQLARSGRSSGGGSSSTKSSYLDDADPLSLTAEEAKKAGAAGNARSMEQALAAYGVQNPAVAGKYGPAIQKVAGNLAAIAQLKGSKAVSFDFVLSSLDQIISEMEANGDFAARPGDPASINPDIIRDVALYMFAPVWGVADDQWGFRAGAYRQLNAMNSNNPATGAGGGGGLASKVSAAPKNIAQRILSQARQK